jgi:hypothetical protein
MDSGRLAHDSATPASLLYNEYASIMPYKMHQLTDTSQAYYTSTLLSIVALGLAKVSVLMLLRRLTPNVRQHWIFDAVTIAAALWTISSLVAVALQCQASQPWITLGQACSRMVRLDTHFLNFALLTSRDKTLRWALICAFDILLEFVIVALAVELM